MKNLLVAVVLGLLFWTQSALSQDFHRVVSFRPNITEILFALGLGSKVVGVTTFCHYPPETEKIPKIGGYQNRSLEKVLSLKPDLVVIVPDATTAKMESALKRAGVETLSVRADSMEDLFESIRSIAAKISVVAQGDSLIQKIQREVETENQSIRNLPKKKALLVIQRRPLIVAGGGTFLDSLLKLAGAQNISGTSQLPYPHYSLESVLSQAPEVIFDLDAGDPMAFWSQYSSLPAVQKNSVFSLPPELFIPSPRVPMALHLLIEKIHRP